MYGFEILRTHQNYICHWLLNNILFYVVKELRLMPVKYIEPTLLKILTENSGKKLSSSQFNTLMVSIICVKNM